VGFAVVGLSFPGVGQCCPFRLYGPSLSRSLHVSEFFSVLRLLGPLRGPSRASPLPQSSRYFQVSINPLSPSPRQPLSILTKPLSGNADPVGAGLPAKGCKAAPLLMCASAARRAFDLDLDPPAIQRQYRSKAEHSILLYLDYCNDDQYPDASNNSQPQRRQHPFFQSDRKRTQLLNA
jgi:hypothetical protein